MRLLLDTHVALWALTDSKRLSERARAMLMDPANELYFSAATVWEIAIKHTLARKVMPLSGRDAHRFFIESGYVELPVLSSHAEAVEALPPIHADPFDRLLVAQSIVEPMRLITGDRQLKAYGVTIEFI